MRTDKKTIQVALLGAGTVGSGFYKLAEKMREEIIQRVSCELNIKYVLVRDAGKPRKGFDSEKFTEDINTIINDSEVEIVVELMGGTTTAREYINAALKAGKHVVTANKDLLAECGSEIFALAKENKCDLQFEAAVAGAIPIIRPIMQNMAGDNITEVMGIVNGTTNYILTRMTQANMSYKDALKEAQDLGYAESDPTADVEGYDAARKVAIISQLIYHSNVTFDDVYKEGISRISFEDIKYAKDLGYIIKLIGLTRMTGGKIEARVHPMLLEDDHPLAKVDNSFNGVFISGEAMDDAMFMGRGAGSLPTASAVLGDVMDVMRNICNDCCGRIQVENYLDIPIMPMEDVISRFFLRTKVQDKPGVLAIIAKVIGDHNIGVDKLIQVETHDGTAEILFILKAAREDDMAKACQAMVEIKEIFEICSLIRVH